MPKNLLSFQEFNDEESQNYLSAHFPNGKLTGKRYVKDSIIYGTIQSIATFIKILVGDIFILAKNRDLSKAEELLPEWETSVKIPEEYPRRDTIEGRREAVACRISKVPVYNIANSVVPEMSTFENYIKCITGIDVTVTTSRVTGTGSNFPLKFAIEFGSNAPGGSFIFLINVPITGELANNTFPWKFAVKFFNSKIPDATIEAVDRVLENIVPSFCRWEYRAIT